MAAKPLPASPGAGTSSEVKLLDVTTPTPPPAVVHLRDPAPIHFPEEAQVPEGKEHLVVRTFLYRLLRFALGNEHSVGSDQFVYWNAREPSRCLAPDVFVRVGVPDTLFGTWKVWERGGPPDLAVEIVSPNEGDGVGWDEKLTRYHELGVKELVRFDPQGHEGTRLRTWDRVADDLVERRVANDTTPCLTLRSTWAVRPVEDAPAGLRLLDSKGDLLLDQSETETWAKVATQRRADREEQAKLEAQRRADREEQAKLEAQRRADREEQAKLEAQRRADREEQAKLEAEARIRELEAELARRGG